MRFDEVGISIQLRARTKSEAIRGFNYSCTQCCYKNRRCDCDRCPIATAHNEAIERLAFVVEKPRIRVWRSSYVAR